jgi:hypothetical protein
MLTLKWLADPKCKYSECIFSTTGYLYDSANMVLRAPHNTLVADAGVERNSTGSVQCGKLILRPDTSRFSRRGSYQWRKL